MAAFTPDRLRGACWLNKINTPFTAVLKHLCCVPTTATVPGTKQFVNKYLFAERVIDWKWKNFQVLLIQLQILNIMIFKVTPSSS